MQQTNDNKFLLNRVGEPSKILNIISYIYKNAFFMSFSAIKTWYLCLYFIAYIQYWNIANVNRCIPFRNNAKTFFETSNSMNLQWPEYIGHLILIPLLRGKTLILPSQYIAQVFWLNFCVLYFKAACSMTHQRHILNW